VKVTAVNVINVAGATKLVNRRKVTAPSRKKAIVTLKAGDKIQLFEGV
jgi:large subunit ribosomal protein L23